VVKRWALKTWHETCWSWRKPRDSAGSDGAHPTFSVPRRNTGLLSKVPCHKSNYQSEYGQLHRGVVERRNIETIKGHKGQRDVVLCRERKTADEQPRVDGGKSLQGRFRRPVNSKPKRIGSSRQKDLRRKKRTNSIRGRAGAIKLLDVDVEQRQVKK